MLSRAAMLSSFLPSTANSRKAHASIKQLLPLRLVPHVVSRSASELPLIVNAAARDLLLLLLLLLLILRSDPVFLLTTQRTVVDLILLLARKDRPVKDVVVLKPFSDKQVAKQFAEVRVVGLVVEAERTAVIEVDGKFIGEASAEVLGGSSHFCGSESAPGRA